MKSMITNSAICAPIKSHAAPSLKNIKIPSAPQALPIIPKRLHSLNRVVKQEEHTVSLKNGSFNPRAVASHLANTTIPSESKYNGNYVLCDNYEHKIGQCSGQFFENEGKVLFPGEEKINYFSTWMKANISLSGYSDAALAERVSLSTKVIRH